MSRLSRLYESILYFSISHSWKKFILMKRNLMKLSKYHKVQSTLKKYKVEPPWKDLKRLLQINCKTQLLTQELISAES